LHERRLAGAVLADEGVDLAGTHLEADAVERDDTRVALADPAHLEEGSGGGGHGYRFARGGQGTSGEGMQLQFGKGVGDTASHQAWLPHGRRLVFCRALADRPG